MQSITMAEGRTMEEPGSCFLVQMKSGAVTSTWVDTSAPMVGMVAQEGISAGSLEVGMEGVGKAHGTSVGTLLEVDGRAPCTDGDADAAAAVDVDVDADADGSPVLPLSKEKIPYTSAVFLETQEGCLTIRIRIHIHIHSSSSISITISARSPAIHLQKCAHRSAMSLAHPLHAHLQ
ncbi:hypothetical protein MJT46_001003 [Ovis ammon polii x Ovis aries]|nr:hypothetical protein MJT46_001003 [Ovis ammon polii x Ovis aries]